MFDLSVKGKVKEVSLRHRNLLTLKIVKKKPGGNRQNRKFFSKWTRQKRGRGVLIVYQNTF